MSRPAASFRHQLVRDSNLSWFRVGRQPTSPPPAAGSFANDCPGQTIQARDTRHSRVGAGTALCGERLAK